MRRRSTTLIVSRPSGIVEAEVARSYQWLRTGVNGTLTASKRMVWLGTGFVTGGGPKTFERGIFGFHITANDINGQPVFRGFPDLTLGLFLWGLSSTPDFDPASAPDGDWLWAGHIFLRPVPYYGWQADALQIGWHSDERQIETTTRRTEGGGAVIKLGLITSPLPAFTDGSYPWGSFAYLSALWSAPA